MPRGRATAWLFLFMTTSLGTGGCSLVFVDGPSTPHPRFGSEPDCTTLYVWPVIDTLLVGTQLYNLHSIAETPSRNFEERPIGKGGTLFLGAAFLTWAAVSAGVGYRRVKSCRNAYNLDNSGPSTPAPAMTRPNLAWPSRSQH